MATDNNKKGTQGDAVSAAQEAQEPQDATGSKTMLGCATAFIVVVLLGLVGVSVLISAASGPSASSVRSKANAATEAAAEAGYPEVTFEMSGSGKTGGSLRVEVEREDLPVERFVEVCEFLAENYRDRAEGLRLHPGKILTRSGPMRLSGCPRDHPEILRAAADFQPKRLESIGIGEFGIGINGAECRPDDEQCITEVMQDAAALTRALVNASARQAGSEEQAITYDDPRVKIVYAIPHGKKPKPTFTEEGEYDLTPRDWDTPVETNYVKAPDGEPEILTTAFTLRDAVANKQLIEDGRFPDVLGELALINASMRGNLLFDESNVNISAGSKTVYSTLDKEPMRDDAGKQSQCGMYLDVDKQAQAFAQKYGFTVKPPEAPYYCEESYRQPEPR